MNAMVKIAVAPAKPVEPAVLWSGRPAFVSTAIRIWKARIAAVYFALLLADGLRLAMSGASAPADAWMGEAKLLTMAVFAVGGLLLLAVLTTRTTRYEIGERGVTLRYGIAFPATLTIPFAAIARVSIRIHSDGTGDVALRLKPGPGVIYPKLWPHARPWAFTRAEPMLRCVPEAGVAGAMICRGVAAQTALAASPQRPPETRDDRVVGSALLPLCA